MCRESFAEIRSETENAFEQSEALVALYHQCGLDAPLPATRKWAGSPDFLLAVANTIADRFGRETHGSGAIIEVSSGISTIVITSMLRKMGLAPGAVEVISLESDEHYSTVTTRHLEDRGLGDYAKVVHAPLKPIPIAGQDFVWYSPEAVEAVSSVDLIVIDGPPMVTGPMARYPAVPVLADKISPGTILLLDDANRADEQEAVRRWTKQHPSVDVAFLPHEKGTARLTWK